MNKKIFSVFMITMLVLGAFAVGTSLAGDPPGPSVTPVPYPGNPSCVELGFPLGGDDFKIENPVSGTYELLFGTVTITTEDGIYFDWTSTFNVFGVIVKGGPNANLYDYRPDGSYGDYGLHSPIHGGSIPEISHIEFCTDYQLLVSKTADTEYTRTWEWEIEKVGDQTYLELSLPQIYPVNYLVTVTGEDTDGDWFVSGEITIYNPHPDEAAIITDVLDEIEGFGPVEVDCGEDFPITLDSLGTLLCSYETDLLDGEDTLNTVTVVVSVDSAVPGGFATAEVLFGDPTDIIDECVDVEDVHYGYLGNVCADEEEKTFTFPYAINIGPFECGESDFVNVATFTTNDTETEGSDSHTVDVYVDCEMGCTLTQGYWKTHSKYGPAPYDPRWENLADGEVDGEDVIFFLSGISNYEILWTSPRGNAYYILAPQYLAAKINILGGAFAPEEVEDVMDWAEDFFETHPPDYPFTRPERQEILQAAELLDAYNNGLIGPGHCSEEGSALASILMFDYESPFGYFEVFLPMSIKR